MSTSCVVCSGSSQCNRCIIRSQRTTIAGLLEKIAYLENSKNDLLQIREYERQKVYHKIIRTTTPQEYDYKDHLSNTRFYTITFDPTKFGQLKLDLEDSYNYIIHHLLEAQKIYCIFSFYGCIEMHQNGNPHAHLLIHSNYHNDIKNYLKAKFTDNMRNKFCIDSGPAKYPQAKEYIDKESKIYFKNKLTVLKPKSQRVLIEIVSDCSDSGSEDAPNDNPLDYNL